MSMKRQTWRVGAATALVAPLLVLTVAGSARQTPAPIEDVGTTVPKETLSLGFDIRGVVKTLAVERGETVKAGQVLMKLNDLEEAAQLEVAKLRADITNQLAEAQARLDLAKVELAQEQELVRREVGSALEVERREAEVQVAEARLAQARHEGAIAQAQAVAQEERVKRYTLSSPIDGVVREIVRKEGENVDESRPVVEVVDIDPLVVEVRTLPDPIVRQLVKGDELMVAERGSDKWRPAKVTFIDPVGDARAGTRFFRLELANPAGPDQIGAGITVDVRVPASVAQQ